MEDTDAILKKPLAEVEITVLLAVLFAKKMRIKSFAHADHGMWHVTLNTGEEITLSQEDLLKAGTFLSTSEQRYAEWRREEQA